MNARDATLLTDIVQAALAGAEHDSWLVRNSGDWCHLEPPGTRVPGQGWKLHVSATRISAAPVLAACAKILIARKCSFKFVPDLVRVAELASRQVDRSSGGKFITIYPDCDRQALRTLAEELHQATIGLAGPRILSDRRYAPESLVHYRYGAMGVERLLGNDGKYEAMLVAPDGSLVPDRRRAWYAPPAWAPADPFADAAVPDPKLPLLNGRYAVSEVIRHSFTGSVYRAVDRSTGATVVIKQSRPHAGARPNGGDARTARHDEAAVLTRLAALPIVPALIETFAHGGDFFLVEEAIDGKSLRQWVRTHCDFDDHGDGWGPNWEVVRHVAGQVVDLVAAIHARGLALRDLSPTNLMVAGDGEVRVVDLAMAAEPGEFVATSFTPVYGSPEQANAPTFGPAPGFVSDLYGLGGVLFYLATGIDPLPAGTDFPDRIEELLAHLAIGNRALRHLGDTILALLQKEPDQRPTLIEVRQSLAEPTPWEIWPSRRDDERVEQIVTDLTAHLLETRNAVDARWLWDPPLSAQDFDPLNVQHGASGVLAVLVRAYQADRREELRLAVSSTAEWIVGRVWGEPRVLPGLYFGRSGTAWALLDAGTELGDRNLVDVAREVCDRVPERWANPDVCHGAAGAGLALLRFWAVTGDERYRSRAAQVAESLVMSADHHDGAVSWSPPKTFVSNFAGLTHHGFAHGTAGIGMFLLAVGRATGDVRYLDLASVAARTLANVAIHDRGATYWTDSERSQRSLTNWCNGSSGIGTFLLRMWQHNSDDELRELCHSSAVAVRRSRWHAGTAQCHGLSGEGEFLLDAAQITGDERYRDWAHEIAECLTLRRVERSGREIIVDDSGSSTAAAFNVGFSGALAFLLRLGNSGPRMWLPTE